MNFNVSLVSPTHLKNETDFVLQAIFIFDTFHEKTRPPTLTCYPHLLTCFQFPQSSLVYTLPICTLPDCLLCHPSCSFPAFLCASICLPVLNLLHLFGLLPAPCLPGFSVCLLPVTASLLTLPFAQALSF